MPVLSGADAEGRRYDLIVIGAGPGGVSLALDAAAQGLSVLLLDAGGERESTLYAEAYGVDLAPDSPHDPPDMTNCRALGGTSHWWGGRGVPLDPEDFERLGPDGAHLWPIQYDDYAPWIAPAADFLGVSEPFKTSPPEAFQHVAGVSADRVERLCPMADVATQHRQALMAPTGPAILLRARAVELLWDEDPSRTRLAGVRVVGEAGALRLMGRAIAIAAGGLETTRLLLLAQQARPALFGGPDGPLGRGYMGHLTGSVAEFRFADPAHGPSFGYQPEWAAGPSRRRFTLDGGAAPNIAFWLETFPLYDARHASSIGSLKHLALHSRTLARRFISDPLRRKVLAAAEADPDANRALSAHIGNILRRPGGAVCGALRILWERVARRPRPPDWLHPSRDGVYRIWYHAEQAARSENRVRLNPADPSRLQVAFAFAQEDIDGVIAAHRTLKAALETAGVASLRLADDAAARAWTQARDGYHQIGLARMSADPDRGVLDGDCRAHDVANLYVASSAAFPSSGQANPTLSIVAFARRLADHLARVLRESDEPIAARPTERTPRCV